MKSSTLFLFIIFFSITVFGQEKTEYVTTEGFYGRSWEYSEFTEIENNGLYKTGWLKFSDSLVITDSLKNVLIELPNMKPIYLKIEALKRSGGSYGHLGAADVEFEVIRVIEMDTTYTMSDFLNAKKE